jgi:hypothetical protein
MENLPIFQYQTDKPIVTGHVRTTKVHFTPQGFANYSATGIGPNNYIRFDFRTTGFWDPKSAYLNIEVRPNAPSIANTSTIYQIDNSAQSLFNQLIIRHNGVELERDNEYDTMAAMIYDMNVGIGNRTSQGLMGLGLGRQPNNQLPSRAGPPVFETGAMTFPEGNVALLVTTATANTNITASINQWRPYLCLQVPSGDNVLTANETTQLYSTRIPTVQVMTYYDYFGLDYSEGVEVSTIGNTGAGVQMGIYNGLIAQAINDFGFCRPYSDAAVGGFEPWMADGSFPRMTISSGLSCYKDVDTLNFTLPLLSPIWGPIAEHGKLIPMALFQGLEFEFLVNPYAFTAYGCPNNLARSNSAFDPTQMRYDSTFTGQQFTANRTNWSITNIELVVEIINLDEQVENAIVSRAATNGVSIPFPQWFLCNKFKNANMAALNSTFQINQSFDSLKMITIRSAPADFENYSFCRKHYYLSMNLTSAQMRVGTEYIPTTPITGHTGCIRTDRGSGVIKGDYSAFLVETQKAWGKFFDMSDSTLINATNYTINSTPFDPTFQFTTPNTITNIVDSMLGMALFNNNRMIGRHMFSFDCEKFDILGDAVRSGINTIVNRPFDINLVTDTSSVTYYPTPIILTKSSNAGASIPIVTDQNPTFQRTFITYVWAYYDATLEYQPSNGWIAKGRY